MPELSEIKRQQRAMWVLGDYGRFAEILQPASDALIARIGLRQGQDLLDVATGTGNAAVAAAGAGARVTGLDLTPELFDVARRRAEEGKWEIDWIEGDAESLPFEDRSFDRVVSVFGAMFAPDHRRAASELVRVCRAGGTVGVCAWTPDGVFGRMIRLIISRTPPPPPGFMPPALWGNEEYARGLFEGLGVSLEFERDTSPSSTSPPRRGWPISIATSARRSWPRPRSQRPVIGMPFARTSSISSSRSTRAPAERSASRSST